MDMMQRRFCERVERSENLDESDAIGRAHFSKVSSRQPDSRIMRWTAQRALMRFGLLQRFGGLPGHPLDPEKGTTLCFHDMEHRHPSPFPSS